MSAEAAPQLHKYTKVFRILYGCGGNAKILLIFAAEVNAAPRAARVRIGSFCVALDRSLPLPFASVLLSTV